MGPSRRKPLGASKSLRETSTFFGCDGAFQLDEVLGLFLLGVRGQIIHENRQRRDESGIRGHEILEDLELFFDLMSGRLERAALRIVEVRRDPR